jgi:hypothetical protein
MGNPMKQKKSAPVEPAREPADEQPDRVPAQCLCGSVRLDIQYPAFWAWHDHSRASRLAHGAAYATYVGTWRKRFRILKGRRTIARYEDETTGNTRAFCSRCGTPVYYERKQSPKWINIPRALFLSRTGRETRYHLNIAEQQDWTYAGAPLVPLKGYPGVVWERPKRKKRREPPPMF